MPATSTLVFWHCNCPPAARLAALPNSESGSKHESKRSRPIRALFADTCGELNLFSATGKLLDESLRIEGLYTARDGRCGHRRARFSVDDDQPARFFPKSALQ